MAYGFRLKCLNEDFIVNEVPFIPQMGDILNAEYTYAALKKSGWTTFDIQEAIKKHFGIDYLDINVEGLKDKNAITTQVISIKKVLSNDSIISFNEKYDGDNSYIKIDRVVGYGKSPLKEGVLFGNCFKIVIRNLTQDDAYQFYEKYSRSGYFSFVNYYDAQRFGTVGGSSNTHLVGKALVDGDLFTAYEELKRSNDSSLQFVNRVQEYLTDKEIWSLFYEKINPNKLKFFLSAYNSMTWNVALSKEIAGKNKGKYFSFNNVGELFIPSDSQFLVNNLCEIAGYTYSSRLNQIITRPFRRSSVVSTLVVPESVFPDELHQGKYAIDVSFFLPTGSYATMLIKQMMYKLD